MVDPDHTELSVSEQCRILGLNRSTYYYERQARRNEADLEDLKRILAVLSDKAFYGYRKVARELRDEHPPLTRKRVRRIMHQFGLRAVFPGPRLSKPGKGHKKYPYLIRGKVIRHPNQVCAADLT